MNTESEAKSKYSDFDESNADEDEDEAYLLQQALAAARAVHHIHDVEFDETKEIDVLTDVNFHVVNVKLPLGRKFVTFVVFAYTSTSCNIFSFEIMQFYFKSTKSGLGSPELFLTGTEPEKVFNMETS